MYTTVLFLVSAATAAVDGGRMVLYPKYVAGGLACYQDRREDGGAFWSYANERQRRPHVFHCPSSLSTWCVNVLTGRLSVRGCSGPTGVNRAGCFHVTDPGLNATSKVCLCKRDLCNDAAAATGPTVALSLTLLLVIPVRRWSTEDFHRFHKYQRDYKKTVSLIEKKNIYILKFSRRIEEWIRLYYVKFYTNTFT